MKHNKNNKKKITPIKPTQPTTRRTDEKDKIKGLAPVEGKIGNKIITDKKYRGNLFSGLMKGITFGLYSP